MKLIRQQGLSLIELMIALALSAGLLAGIVQIFVSSKQNYQISSSASDLEENARAALDELSDAFRYRGFQGCPPPRTNDPSSTYPPLSTTFPLAANPIQDLWKESLVGYHINDKGAWSSLHTANQGTFSTNLKTVINGTEPIPVNRTPINNSDVVSIFHASTARSQLITSREQKPRGYVNAQFSDGLIITSATSGSNPMPQWAIGDHIVIGDCTRTAVFTASNVYQNINNDIVIFDKDLNLPEFSLGSTGNPTQVRKALVDIFYVAPTGRSTANGTAINGLFRLRASDAIPAPVEIAEGINNLTILYGELFNSGRVQYRTANEVNDFRSVYSVRITFTAASTISSSTNVPNRSFSTTIQLRNGVDSMTSP